MDLVAGVDQLGVRDAGAGHLAFASIGEKQVSGQRLASVTPLVGVSPHRQSPTLPQSQQQEYDTAVADCMRMWNSGTHMTKQEWARTCKRVQTRLDNLKVDGLIPEKSR